MLVVLVQFEMEPALRTRFMDDRRSMAERTRRERGCLQFDFAHDVTDDRVVHLVERWESARDLAAHLGVLQAAPPVTEVAFTQRVVCFEVAREVDLPDPIDAD